MRDGAIQPDGVARPDSPYSPVFASGDLVYTAGQIGATASGEVAEGIEAQTRQALENLRACLEAAGCTLRDVMKVNSYLADISFFPAYNAVYREFFEEPFPARTTVGAALADGLLVEIEAIARRSA
jgi:2-iminobutanoate/2-iminopropanoate deaminase